MHYLENVNSVLELKHHIDVRPVAFFVFAVFKKYEKGRLVLGKWSFVGAPIDLYCRILICIFLTGAQQIYLC